MKENMKENMNYDSIELLSECSSGLNMAIDSMEYIKNNVEDKQLIQIINKYLTSHEKILDDCCTLLHDAGAKEKEVSVFSKALSTIQAKIKMMMDDDKSTAAALLTDGCGMGVKTISEELNKYKMAGDEAKDIAKRLRKIEEDMIGDLQPML